VDGSTLAINVENDRLVAVLARVGGGRVQIEQWLSVERPASVDGTDAAAVGRWINEAMERAGMSGAARRAGAVFAVPRGEVVLKRISFPPGGEEEDLPAMVRLQMLRQLTVSPETAAIDFVVLPAGAGAISAGAAGGINVLAAALQGDRVQWRREVARAAGLRLRQVALKAAGAAALLAEASAKGGGLMGIAVGCGSTEFAIVEDGPLVLARATDLMRPVPEAAHGRHIGAAEAEAFAEKVAVEAKRTWMSYRVGPDSVEIDKVVVLGEDDVCRRVAEKCAAAMELPSVTATYPAPIEAPTNMPAEMRAAVAPLAGMIMEAALGRQTLDFANPRRAPDRAAALRRRVLLGTAASIAILGGGYTWGRMDTANLERELEGLKSEWSATSGAYSELVRNKARVEHIKRWTEARINWLAHLAVLAERIDPRQAQVDSLTGRAEAEIAFKLSSSPGASREYTDDAWQQAVQAIFTLEGQMKERRIADALRQTILSDERYKIESQGADLWDRFEFRLTTNRRWPDEVPKSQPAAAEAGKKEAGT
jgi:hypothetical protein